MATKTVYVDGTTSTDHFATLAAWITWQSTNYPNLTTDNGTGGAGRVDVEISKTDADTTAANIDGIATDASSYINIYTTAAARHSGVWSDSKYRIVVASGTTAYGLYVSSVNYCRIAGVQIEMTGTTAARVFFMNGQSASSDVRISNCVIKGNTPSSGNSLYIHNDGGGVLKAWNIIAYGGGTAAGRGVQNESTGQITIYNSTIIGYQYGIRSLGGTVTANGCYVGGQGTEGFNRDGGTLAKTDCASYDGSADDTGTGETASSCESGNILADDTAFVSVAGNNYHLAGTGSGLYNLGYDNTGDSSPLNFTTDIDGDTITGRFDIGADFYVAAATGQSARPSSDVAGGTFRSIHTTAPFGPIVIA